MKSQEYVRTLPNMLSWIQRPVTTLFVSRQGAGPNCLSHAKGQAHYQPAASTLIEYLDFKDPATLSGSKRVRRGGIYPAEAALESLGAFSIPYLKRAIADDGDSSMLRRVNAAATLFFVAENKPEALAFIMKSAHDSQDAEMSKGLIGVGEKLLRFCSSKDADECQYVWGSR